MGSATRPVCRDRRTMSALGYARTQITRTPSMSRQDANAAFALSSFLQGTNATYIDDIYARYERDPASVDPEWQEFFQSLEDPPADVIAMLPMGGIPPRSTPNGRSSSRASRTRRPMSGKTPKDRPGAAPAG